MQVGRYFYTFITLFAVVASSFSTQAITIIETTPVHFGSIFGQFGFQCVMSQFGEVGGDCDATDANISRGTIVVTDLPRKGTVEVVITSAPNASLDYSPAAEIFGAKGGTALLTPNQPVLLEVKGNGADFTINVFGTLSITDDLRISQPYTADYTIQVNAL
jgi:hypothetical protein